MRNTTWEKKGNEGDRPGLFQFYSHGYYNITDNRFINMQTKETRFYFTLTSPGLCLKEGEYFFEFKRNEWIGDPSDPA